MAPTVWGGGRSSAITTANFACIGVTLGLSSIEANRQLTMRKSGTFQKFSAAVDANGTARSVILRKNAANSGLVINPTDGVAGLFQDSTHSAAVSIGDKIGVEFIATGTGPLVGGLSLLFFADVGTVGFYPNAAVGTATFPSWRTLGSIGFVATESQMQYGVRAPATYQNMLFQVDVNTATVSNTFISRKNGANGNLSLTIGAGLTGAFEDTVHSDSLVSGDTFAYQVNAGGSGNVQGTLAVHAVFSTDASEVVGGGLTAAFNAANQFVCIAGGFSVNASENIVAVPLGFDGVLSNHRFNVRANTMTGTWTYAVRKNGVTGNQTLSVGAGLTGGFEDTTHVDRFLAADKLNFVASGGVSGSISFGWSSLTTRPFVALNADPAAFALTGGPESFTISEGSNVGAFALTGVPLGLGGDAGVGAFASTGLPASFNVSEAVAAGSFTLNGQPVNEIIFVPEPAGSFMLTGYDAILTRTGADFDLTYGGVGHYLLEAARAKQLAYVKRQPPAAIDRRSAPQFEPLARPPVAPSAPLVDMAAVQEQRTAVEMQAAKAAKKQRDLEAILLLIA
jgi:hypothetical protein